MLPTEQTPPAPGPALRLGLFYAASFLVVGVQLPFWSPWLKGRGLAAEEIALVFALSIWANVVATPAVGAPLAREPRAEGGDNRVLALVLAASLLLCAATIALPQPASPAPRPAAPGGLAGQRRFWLVAASAALLQASHQLYYGFGTLYW